ncbi:dsRBD fold-containing protein [Planomonospora corallina]|uniref:DsRBD fold-containing protein n=1 Tax=Planomonospora corallina TaxID=1806052 RepID=A0ABV8IDE0_9ACTN
MQSKQWNVKITIVEDDNDRVTSAQAVLDIPDGRTYESVEYARRNPTDRPVPDIGDELAAGRVLADLSGRLMGDAAADVMEEAELRRR